LAGPIPGTASSSSGAVLHVCAVHALAALDARNAKAVEPRFVASLEMKGVAEVLRIGTATAEHDWHFARALLRPRLGYGVHPRAGVRACSAARSEVLVAPLPAKGGGCPRAVVPTRR